MSYPKIANSELKRKSIEEFKNAIKTPVTIVLDDIRSLNNIGSVFRTADAFLLKKIILCGITATPPHKDIQKTALGATNSVEWEYEKDIVKAIVQLKESKVSVQAVEQTKNSTLLQDFVPPRDKEVAFIFGNEVSGVSQKALELVDGVIEIPQFGVKHSLNISVSVGVVCWHYYVSKKRFSF